MSVSDDDVKHWVYAGGIDYSLTEGDLMCIFSQFGEVEDFVLSRDRDTGKPRGFGFAKYQDPRSCELAVDNFNGSTVSGRRLKVSLANNMNVIRAIKSRPPVTANQQQQYHPQYPNKSNGEESDRPVSSYNSLSRHRQRSRSSSGSEIERRPRERVPYRAEQRYEPRTYYPTGDLRSEKRHSDSHFGGDRFEYAAPNGGVDIRAGPPALQRSRETKRPRSRSSSSRSSSSSSSSSTSSSSSSSSSSSASERRKRGRKDKKKSSRRKHRRHHKSSKSSKHDKKTRRSSSPASPSSRHRKRKSKKSNHKTRSRSRSPGPTSSSEQKSHSAKPRHEKSSSSSKRD